MNQKTRVEITPTLRQQLSAFAAEHHITAAEFRVLCGLIEGLSAAEISAHESLSYETVRSQLKSIFSKTHTHRQAALLALVLHYVTRLKLR